MAKESGPQFDWRTYRAEVYHLLGPARRTLPGLLALFLALSLLDLAGIGLVGPYIALIMNPRALDGALGGILEAAAFPPDRESSLVLLGLLLGLIFLVKSIAAIAIHAANVRFAQDRKAALRSELMRAYQRLPYAHFLGRNSADLVYAIESLTAEFAVVVQTGLRMASDALVALAILALLAWQDAPALAVLAGLFAVALWCNDRLFRRKLQDYGAKGNLAGSAMIRGIHEGIEGLKEIRVLGTEDHFHRMVRDGAGEVARYITYSQVVAIVPRYLLEFTVVAFAVGMVLVAPMLGKDVALLVPTLGVFAVAAVRLLPAANSVANGLAILRYHRNSVARLYRDVAGMPPEARGAPADPAPPEPFETLALDHVQFIYEGSGAPALDDVSLQVRADESIGFVGPSGSGKTTLVDVLLGLLEPRQGEVRFNGKPLSRALAAWRANVAYLPQQVFLVDDALRRNVALGVADDRIDEDRLKEALRQARLAELVAGLPLGVDTVVGERGIRLSGGQRQRVALARAFYHGRSVLVMDEATSSLDSETEREIVEEIRQLKGRKTLIVIAHRLTTVEHCDRIYRLESGRIVAEGTLPHVMAAGKS